jgi:hypothetical protein
MYGDGNIRAGLQRRLEGRQELAEILSIGCGLIKKENCSGQRVRSQGNRTEQAGHQYCRYAQQHGKFLAVCGKRTTRGRWPSVTALLPQELILRVNAGSQRAPPVAALESANAPECKGAPHPVPNA